MFQSATTGGAPPFEILVAEPQRIPIVLNSPHSGSMYSQDFLASSQLDARAIRGSEDVLVDQLLEPAAALGAPMLRANFPRAWLDVNREPYELDPAMFDADLPIFANSRSVRVTGGLGTVPRIVSVGEEIYRRKMDLAEALNRIETVYRPYHRALHGLLSRSSAAFGLAVLMDCHSMPSARHGGRDSRPDFVLGDRFGTSCHTELTDFCAAALGRLGYTVARNRPYAGGYITEHYGRPRDDLHAMQLEINRHLYIDERTLEPVAGFGRLRSDLGQLIAELAAALNSGLLDPRQAAE
jgi:N-formylglutamate amidohydrolase